MSAPLASRLTHRACDRIAVEWHLNSAQTSLSVYSEDSCDCSPQTRGALAGEPLQLVVVMKAAVGELHAHECVAEVVARGVQRGSRVVGTAGYEHVVSEWENGVQATVEGFEQVVTDGLEFDFEAARGP